ncbi:MAG: hypothetical protein KTR28_08660 [Micavibrio sp.]|nr:hypothetical protein [Micavibrio sp.]
MKRLLKLTVFAICLGTAACGIKPDSVSAPGGEDASSFPRTYPDLSHDPTPKG